MNHKKGPNVRDAALQLLLKTFRGGGYSNFLFESAVEKNPKFDERDRAFLKSLFFGVLRNAMVLDYHIARKCDRPVEKLPAPIRNILRLGLYQAMFMERVPDHAAVGESVTLAKMYGHKGTAGLVNAVLRKLSSETLAIAGALPVPHEAEEFSIRFSHPLWMVEKMLAQYGSEKTAALLEANNGIPPANYRVQDWSMLEKSGMTFEMNRFNTHGVTLNDADVKTVRTLVSSGAITPQDQSSLIAVSLARGLGGRAIELCSGRGNKTGILKSSLKAGSLLIASDLSLEKIAASRKKGKVTPKVCLDASRPLPFRRLFDVVFADLPCSNLGAVRRHPEIRYSRSKGDVEAASKLQRAILENGSKLVAPDGKFIYAVCSVEPEETFMVIKEFLSANSRFRLLDIGIARADLADAGLVEKKCLKILPGDHRMDGMFAAVLVSDG